MSLVQPPVLSNEARLFDPVHHSNLMNAKPMEPLPLLVREPGPQDLPRLPPMSVAPPITPQPPAAHPPENNTNPVVSGNYGLPGPTSTPTPTPVPTQPPVPYGYYPHPLTMPAPSAAAYYSPVPTSHFDFSLSYPAPSQPPSGPAPPPMHYHTVPAPNQCLPPYMPPHDMAPSPNYPHYPVTNGIPINGLLPPGNIISSHGYPLLHHQPPRARSVSSPVVEHAKSAPRRQRRTDDSGLVYEILRPHECQQCGARQTPEWRRGPAECRVLCNACGLFHNKAVKRKGKVEALRMLRERPRVLR